MAGLQLMYACIGLCLLICSKKNSTWIKLHGQHPLTLIYRVLRYAWNHTCPENHSALTYWEEDIPPCIDLGKNKLGEPFTTEEVEDTKMYPPASPVTTGVSSTIIEVIETNTLLLL